MTSTEVATNDCATTLSGVNSSLKAKILMHSLVNLGGGKGYAYLFQEIGNRYPLGGPHMFTFSHICHRIMCWIYIPFCDISS